MDRRVLIVAAAMGAGHTQVADELARRLSGLHAETEVVDLLQLAGPSGERLRRTYQLLLDRAPWLYDAAMRFWARHPGPLEGLVAAGARSAENALRAAIGALRPDVVVSTYNLASQALGRLVARGEVDTRVVTLVTDPGAHPYWVSEYVDLHIALLPQTAAALEAYGAPHVVVAPPLVRPEMHAAPDPAGARRALGLTGRNVLVTAGSWAAGRVRRTVAALLDDPTVTVMVLCGHDDRLRADLSGWQRVQPIGWTNQIPAYLAAVDVVIDNAGGLTCWEALSCGTPVVLFDPLPGHGRLNAAALADAGLVRVAHNRAQLLLAVREARPAQPFEPASESAESYVLALADQRVAPDRSARRVPSRFAS